ncbi:hypothetical protein LX32DRAFT_251869 [Colletotrichum zoysiae]|uniref:Uncharacterized protein n=1 Tax=Colletotrichum zoysiae TaxID=1216348 RepID=A0AAD9H415_9PEZI|nr:hypothetical protein LX32DRAFT_251869 [Colletotrichum zoysiae]
MCRRAGGGSWHVRGHPRLPIPLFFVSTTFFLPRPSYQANAHLRVRHVRHLCWWEPFISETPACVCVTEPRPRLPKPVAYSISNIRSDWSTAVPLR